MSSAMARSLLHALGAPCAHVALDRFGRGAGMELHRRAWYRRSDEVIAVSGLQRSQYGRQYYFKEQRIAGIVALLEERILPMADRGASVVELRAMADDRTLESAAIGAAAQPALGLRK